MLLAAQLPYQVLVLAVAGCRPALLVPWPGSQWGITKGQSVFHSILTKKKCISPGKIVVELFVKF